MCLSVVTSSIYRHLELRLKSATDVAAAITDLRAIGPWPTRYLDPDVPDKVDRGTACVETPRRSVSPVLSTM